MVFLILYTTTNTMFEATNSRNHGNDHSGGNEGDRHSPPRPPARGGYHLPQVDGCQWWWWLGGGEWWCWPWGGRHLLQVDDRLSMMMITVIMAMMIVMTLNNVHTSWRSCWWWQRTSLMLIMPMFLTTTLLSAVAVADLWTSSTGVFIQVTFIESKGIVFEGQVKNRTKKCFS